MDSAQKPIVTCRAEDTKGPVSWGVVLRRVHRDGSPRGQKCDTECRGRRAKLQEPRCSVCNELGLVLLANTACRHSACERCWRKWAESRLACCVSSRALLPDCFEEGCCEAMAQEIWRRVATRSDLAAFARLSEERLARCRCLESRVILAVPPGLVCSSCGENQEFLVANAGCDHAACEGCWRSWSEQQLLTCECTRARRARCIEPCCQQPLSNELWASMHPKPSAVTAFVQATKGSIERLKRTAGPALRWSTADVDAGPLCEICREHCCALLVNSRCGHAACEDCWQTWVEMQLPQCRGVRRAEVRCIGACCQALAVGASRNSIVGTWQLPGHVQGDSSYAIHENDSKFTVDWGGASGELVLEGEWYTAMLKQHGSHFGQVRLRPVPNGVESELQPNWTSRFSARAVAQSKSFIWIHLCARSKAVDNLELSLNRRKRLQENELYPAEVQVECPRAECLGLGYRGSGNVMCFLCEHQWALEGEEGAAEGAGDVLYAEMVAKRQIKECPQCSAGILKNGGCDHMTCRCGYEFWWTTMKPCH